MTWLSKHQINLMAESILTTHEVTPLSYDQKCRVGREYALDEFGIEPNNTAVKLAVKLADLGWHNTVLEAKRKLDTES